MKTLKIVFDKENLDLTEESKELTVQQMSYNMIQNLVMAYAQNKKGLSEVERRLYYKVCDVFDKALQPTNNGQSLPEKIKLEDEWMGFIRKCKKETLLLPNKVFRKVEENIDDVKDR